MGTTMAITSRLLKMSAIFLLLAGCAEVTVHRTDNSHLLEDWRTSLMEPDVGHNGGPDVRLESLTRIFDPHFRLACDLYNSSLAKCLRAALKSGPIDPNQPVVFRTGRGSSLTLTIERQGFPWRPDEFGEL